jgi:hypothetical protein
MTKKEFKKSEGGRVREELRNLRRVKAPWYFEAELQQRLRMAEKRPRRQWSPIPAYALSTIAVIAIGVIGYYMILLPLTANQETPKIEGIGQSETRSPVPPREIQQSTPSAVMSQSEQGGEQPAYGSEEIRSGPSQQQADRIIEAPVMHPTRYDAHIPEYEENIHSPSFELDHQTTTKKDIVVPSLESEPLQHILHVVPDSAVRRVVADSTDSLHVQADSVQRPDN